MARPLRTILQGGTYHCYSKCHDNQNFLLSSLGKQLFIEAVLRCQKKYKFKLSAAELAGNHMHLVIITLENEATISRIMQYIKSLIGQKYNRLMNRGGAFWISRFKCKIVEESDDPILYLLRLLWYTAYNPVRKNLCVDPRESFTGFINCYLTENYKPPIEITLHPFFRKLGNTFTECVEKFLLYEEAYKRNLAAV